jgi:hypothetical protein
MRGHGAGDNVVDFASFQSELVDQALQCVGKHVEITEICVSRIRAAEWNTDAADYGDPFKLRHDASPF